MRNLFLGLSLAAFLSACATTSPENTSSKSQYSSDEIMGLMLGAGKRDSAKLNARLDTASKYPLGSKNNPVRVHMPAGERAYLNRLRCENGEQPTYNRIGNFGPGPYETIIDGYKVDCANSSPETSTIYMDMYFPKHHEQRAVSGYTIID